MSADNDRNRATGDMTPWVGVDFDGTLAKYVSGQGNRIGGPVPRMVKRVKRFLGNGHRVKILTARVASNLDPMDRARNAAEIAAWCEQHVGQVLEVTAEKDFAMVELWDDLAIRVNRNTGRIASGLAGRKWRP